MNQSSVRPAGEHLQAEGDAPLVHVIEKLHDSIAILQDLARRTRLPQVRHYAERHVRERRRFNEELRLELKNLGNEPGDGTVPGLMRRILKDLKSVLPNAEANMLIEVERGEASLRAAYLQALEGNSASQNLRDKYHYQQASVVRAQAELHSLLTHVELGTAGR